MTTPITRVSTSLISAAHSAWSTTLESVIHSGWSPLVSVAERAVVTLLQRMTFGRLRVITQTRTYVFGRDATGEPTCDIRVLNDAFWLRLAATSDLGFAESYMYGEIEVSSLLDAFRLFLLNRSALSSLSTTASYLVSIPQTFITSSKFMNTISNSREHIAAHYDISNKMFAAFLSEDMAYSCGIFPELDGDVPLGGLSNGNGDAHGFDESHVNGNGNSGAKVNGEKTRSTKALPSNGNGYTDVNGNTKSKDNGHAVDSSTPRDPLFDAQERKFIHIIKKADIKAGHRVLEIGSGWGWFAILAVKMTGCTVDTLTLSSSQQQLAQTRIDEAGLTSSIKVHLLDYRNMPSEWNDTFDRFVSIEMIESVGKEFLDTYWSIADRVLKKQDAVGVVQVITIPEAIFPGGFLPSLTLLLTSLEKGSAGRLVVDSVSNIGPHYARTLREWRRRFEDKFESDIVPALREEYPNIKGGTNERDEIEVFRRKWLYYFLYSEIGFTERVLGDHIVTFTREGNTTYGCKVTS